MSDARDLRIEPVGPADAAQPVQAAHVEHPAAERAAQQQRPAPGEPDAVAAVGGHLRGAYAQYVVDPDTNDVVVRIRDVATDRLLHELPSPEVQALTRYFREYPAMLARLRIATQA